MITLKAPEGEIVFTLRMVVCHNQDWLKRTVMGQCQHGVSMFDRCYTCEPVALAACGCPEFDPDCPHIIKVPPSELAANENKRKVKPASPFAGMPVNTRGRR